MKWNYPVLILLILTLGIAGSLRAQTSEGEREAAAPAAPLACFVDAYEPNDTCGAGSAPAGAGLHTPLYLCTGEEDWYAVEVPAGYRLEAELLFTHSSVSDIQAQLWNESCSGALDASFSSTDNELVAAGPESGARTLYVRAMGQDGADESSYELQVDLTCPDCFTYQGQLQDGGAPASGSYDFAFQLYDAVSGGSPLTTTIYRTVTVTGGTFTVELYFGDPAAYAGSEGLFLELGVRPEGAGSYTTLIPRQELTPTPRALTLMPGAVISDTRGSSTPSLSVVKTTGSGNGLRVQGAYTAVAVEDTQYGVYVNNTTYDGLYVSNAGWRGLAVVDSGTTGVYASTDSNAYWGGYFENNGSTEEPGAGLYANGNTNAAPDIQLGGSQGRIAADATSSADLFQMANSDVIVDLDQDNNSSNSFFGVRDGSDGYLFYVYESTNAYFTGNLSKGGGSFVIDHPLDPENQLLYHSFVESPDMMNVYNGNVELDEQGEAWVELPAYFQALNRDFRYQLTPIGAPGPNLYVAQEVQENRFQIAGGSPGMTVSWQVTGIRQDPYANANRIEVEVAKTEAQQGRYLHPDVWGQPSEASETAPAQPAIRLGE